MMLSKTFEITATLIFLIAIIHTFLTPTLYVWSRKLAAKKRKNPDKSRFYHFSSEIVYLLSEVEVVFGIWLIPLLVLFYFMEGQSALVNYLNAREFNYPLFIMVSVMVVSSRPIISFADKILAFISRLGNDTPASWWWTILTVGPLLAIFLKEPGAMTLCAILLAKKFYLYKPSKPFQYATLALLFANVAVGSLLTTFSARTLYIVANTFGWDNRYIFLHFGWKSILGIILANTLYYLIFRKEFKREIFPKRIELEKKDLLFRVPLWITIIHLFFLFAIVYFSSFAPIFVGIFFLFLGFHQATLFYQSPLDAKGAILVGFFFASLLVHGDMQKWWIIPLYENLNHFGTLIVSFILSAFVDDAAIATIAVKFGAFESIKKRLLIYGAISAASLTVIANVPNPIGLSLLRKSFGNNVSFSRLFFYALLPSLLFLTLFWLLPH